ncbi:MAG: DUF4147 domain-containing protein [Patescibacteria group bacterium]|nr:DUF4147 domain-containing protein [Patescibacteria group bacterium]
MSWIKNFDELATNEDRKIALEIAEAGFEGISTKDVIKKSLILEGDILIIQGQSFNLKDYKSIKVVGFGKASAEAAVALEEILKEKITKGIVISLAKAPCQYIETFAGTHPRPSDENVKAGKKIYEMIKDSDENDLIIAIVSGGGSSLLCWPETERDQGIKLYDSFLKSGQTISELNTVRKHLSGLKGGGLAKLAFPSTIISFVFSDVPGEHFETVASGPTYKDKTTKEDAQRIIDEHDLGEYELIETPKDDKYFENVYNFVLVSNKVALSAMAEKAKELNLNYSIASSEMYDEVSDVLKKIFEKEGNLVLAAGEPELVVDKKGGSGGRNIYMCLKAIDLGLIDEDSIFIAIASDGIDNCEASGAIVDKETLQKIKNLNINIDTYLDNFDILPVFKQTNDLIMTGPTGANVSDLMILFRK